MTTIIIIGIILVPMLHGRFILAHVVANLVYSNNE